MPSDARYEAAGTALVLVDPDGSRRPVELGCPVRAATTYAGCVLVACGPGGVVVLAGGADGGLEVWNRFATDGEATGVFVRGERIWVELQRTEARPLGPAMPTAPWLGGGEASRPPSGQLLPFPSAAGAADGAPPQPAAAKKGRQGRVVAIEPGEVIVDLGEADGLAVDMRVRLTLRRSGEMDAGQLTDVVERVAVGEVVEVAPNRARVRLGLNEQVPLGATAERTSDETTSSLIAPPRPSDQWHMGFHVRPFLALGDLAVGVLSTVEVGYRGESDWHLRVLGEPLGFAVGQDPALGAVSAIAAGSYDHQLFEVGAGIGATRFAGAGSNRAGPRTVFSIVPMARLGAIDGFHLEVHNGFVILADQFQYGSTTGLIQIPLARSAALQLRGGGGVAGYAFGELGLRVLAAGNGEAGTVLITPSLGAAFMFGAYECTQSICRSTTYAGPMVGLGLEYRL